MEKMLGRLYKVEVYTAAGGFGTTCLIVFISAVARTMHHPLNWSLDLALFFFAWSVFLSADAAMRSDKLVNVDIVLNAFPERWRATIMALNYLIICGFLVALIVFGLRLAYTTRVRTFQGIPGFSYTWVTLSLPVGSALLLRTTALKLRDSLRKLAPGGVERPPADANEGV